LKFCDFPGNPSSNPREFFFSLFFGFLISQKEKKKKNYHTWELTKDGNIYYISIGRGDEYDSYFRKI